MGADDRELVVGDSLEAGSLWEDFPQLDVVFLAAALLPGLQRVAVVDGAAPASVHASLDRLVVEELGPPVSEEDVEAVHERLPPAEHLDAVERPRHALRGMRRQHHHDLKAEAPEQECEDGFVRAFGRHHAVHFDGRHLDVVVEPLEVLVCPALKGMPERDLVLLSPPPRLVFHLFGELEVADVEDPEIDVAVERPRSDGKLGPVGLPDMAQALPLLHQRLHHGDHCRELLGRAVDALAARHLRPCGLLVCRVRVVEPAAMPACERDPRPAPVAHVRRPRELGAFGHLDVLFAHLVACRAGAPRASRIAARPAHVRHPAAVAELAEVLAVQVLVVGGVPGPVPLDLAGHRRPAYADLSGDRARALAVSEHVFDHAPIEHDKVPAF